MGCTVSLYHQPIPVRPGKIGERRTLCSIIEELELELELELKFRLSDPNRDMSR